MDEIIVISALFKLGVGLVACVMLHLATRHANWALGIKFKRDIMPQLRQNPVSLSIYTGARILAYGLIIGLALS